jgi:hypothetical protein
MSTFKPIKSEHLGGFQLLPARPGVCPECAIDHNTEAPHNAQSLYYQYHFYAKHGRWPNWLDAIEHCPEPTKKLWIEHLTAAGVDVVGGKVHPEKKGKVGK